MIEDDDDADISIDELAETSALRRLTIEGQNRYPVWSSDGKRVAFQSDRAGGAGIFWQPADGQSDAERLTTAGKDANHVPESFSPDGRHLLYREATAGMHTLHVLSMDDKKSVPFGKVSSGVFRFRSQRGASTITRSGRVTARLSSLSERQRCRSYAVGVRTQPTLTFDVPIEVSPKVPRPSLQTGAPRGYDVLPDGRLLIVSPRGDQGSAAREELHVVVNWSEELKRLVPTNQARQP